MQNRFNVPFALSLIRTAWQQWDLEIFTSPFRQIVGGDNFVIMKGFSTRRAPTNAATMEIFTGISHLT